MDDGYFRRGLRARVARWLRDFALRVPERTIHVLNAVATVSLVAALVILLL